MNPYQTLGLHFDATKEDVKDAYRRLAKQFHPDTTAGRGDPERFARINEAYRTLMDRLDGSSGQSAPRQANAPTTRADVRRDLVLTVREAMEGCRMTLEGVSGPCAACGGDGTVPAPHPVECVPCAGTGTLGTRSSGFIKVSISCDSCAGSGKVRHYTCHGCGGVGTLETASCVVDIPPATRHGDVLIVPGGANQPSRNVTGDVLLQVLIRDPKFRMVDNDVETVLHLQLWEAVLGCTAVVAAPTGESHEVRVPRDTRHGTRLRIRNKGLNYTEARGDLVAVVSVRQPKSSESGVAEAMEALRRAAGVGEPRS